jgi:hypothetical protein
MQIQITEKKINNLLAECTFYMNVALAVVRTAHVPAASENLRQRIITV